jgi:hypothetical protein
MNSLFSFSDILKKIVALNLNVAYPAPANFTHTARAAKALQVGGAAKSKFGI